MKHPVLPHGASWRRRVNVDRPPSNDTPKSQGSQDGADETFQDERYLRPEKLDRLLRKHLQGALVRSGASLFMWFFVLVAFVAKVVQVEHFVGVSAAVGFLILINPPTLWLLKRVSRRRLFEFCSLLINALEILGYTSIIYFLGGIEAAYLTPIYAALITYVGVVAPRRLSFITAGLCSLLFSAMVFLEYAGLIPHRTLVSHASLPLRVQLLYLTIVIGLLYVVAFISAYTADLLKKNREALREQNEELERSRTELGRAAERLKQKNSQLKVAIGKARESDRLKSEFLANMSHELRTPLNHIIGFTELIADRRLGDLNDTQAEYLNDVLKSGHHLLALINDVLDLSKIEAGKLELVPSEVTLKQLLKDSLAMVRQKATARQLSLVLDLDGIPDVITADERKLKQVLYNLLSNAVKFTPNGGRIRLAADVVDSEYTLAECSHSDPWGKQRNKWISAHQVVSRFVRISVEDNGIGIRAEDQKRIFDPFEQADNSASRRYQGTGLGLSLSKTLVELHGGKIWVESAGESQGTAFRLTLPIGVRALAGSPCGLS